MGDAGGCGWSIVTSGAIATVESDARWWWIPRTERRIAGGCLLVTIFLAAAPAAAIPWTSLDVSWQVAINAARSRTLHFGSDLIYTYGPWGFVDHPYPLDRAQYTIAVLVGIAVVAALWLASYIGLRRLVRSRAAAVVATVSVVLSASVAEISTLAVTTAGMVVLLELLNQRDDEARSLPFGLVATGIALCSGLFLQVKLSTGVALLVVAAVAAFTQRPWRRALFTLVTSTVCVIISFLVLWLIDGQDIRDIQDWVHGSWQMVVGYSDAMAVERTDNVFGYVVALGLAAFIVVTAVRGARSFHRVQGVALLVLCVALLDIMFKAAFTRHDTHEFAFFVMTTGLVIALGSLTRRRASTMLALTVSLLMTVPSLLTFDVGPIRDRWRTALEVAVTHHGAEKIVETSREQGRNSYLLPTAFIDLIGQQPVSVDPFEASLPIDYGMQWRPFPVFQNYAAYTPYLDDLNASAARDAPSDQLVLRTDGAAIDGRNWLWETPAYVLALACDYQAVHREAGWTLLEHATDICGTAIDVGSRRVEAGEKVTIPQAGPDQIVVARFAPTPDGLGTRALAAVFKNPDRFTVSVDDVAFRMPVALAGQPAMMSYPDRGERGPFLPFEYRSVAYSRPGTVTFETLSTDR